MIPILKITDTDNFDYFVHQDGEQYWLISPVLIYREGRLLDYQTEAIYGPYVSEIDSYESIKISKIEHLDIPKIV